MKSSHVSWPWSRAPIMILAPVALGDGESYATMFNRLKNSGSRASALTARQCDFARGHARRGTAPRRSGHRSHDGAGRGRGIAEASSTHWRQGNGLVVVVKEAVETVREGGIEGSRIKGSRDRGFEQCRRKQCRCATAKAQLQAVPLRRRSQHLGVRCGSDFALITVNTPARDSCSRRSWPACAVARATPNWAPTSSALTASSAGAETCEGLGVQRGPRRPKSSSIPIARSSTGPSPAGGVNPKTPFGKMLGMCDHLGIAATRR